MYFLWKYFFFVSSVFIFNPSHLWPRGTFYASLFWTCPDSEVKKELVSLSNLSFHFFVHVFLCRFLARHSLLASKNIQTQDYVFLQSAHRPVALTCIACHFWQKLSILLTMSGHSVSLSFHSQSWESAALQGEGTSLSWYSLCLLSLYRCIPSRARFPKPYSNKAYTRSFPYWPSLGD